MRYARASQLVALCYSCVHEHDTQGASVCVRASFTEERKPAAAAAAAVVQRSVFSVWMLALPLSAVGRSLTVGIHTHTNTEMHKYMCTYCCFDTLHADFLVGYFSIY